MREPSTTPAVRPLSISSFSFSFPPTPTHTKPPPTLLHHQPGTKAEINAELRQQQVYNSVDRREDAVLAAEDEIRVQREVERDLEAERASIRIQETPRGSPV